MSLAGRLQRTAGQWKGPPRSLGWRLSDSGSSLLRRLPDDHGFRKRKGCSEHLPIACAPHSRLQRTFGDPSFEPDGFFFRDNHS
jgi:hypothetical protein